MEANGSAGSETGGRVEAQNGASEDITAGTAGLSTLSKQQVIEKFRREATDTGSPEVQIALLTRRLESLSKHFSAHPQDHHSQRGMMEIVSHRKRLLQYLKQVDVSRYRSTLSALGLRK